MENAYRLAEIQVTVLCVYLHFLLTLRCYDCVWCLRTLVQFSVNHFLGSPQRSSQWRQTVQTITVEKASGFSYTSRDPHCHSVASGHWLLPLLYRILFELPECIAAGEMLPCIRSVLHVLGVVWELVWGVHVLITPATFHFKAVCIWEEARELLVTMINLLCKKLRDPFIYLFIILFLPPEKVIHKYRILLVTI